MGHAVERLNCKLRNSRQFLSGPCFVFAGLMTAIPLSSMRIPPVPLSDAVPSCFSVDVAGSIAAIARATFGARVIVFFLLAFAMGIVRGLNENRPGEANTGSARLSGASQRHELTFAAFHDSHQVLRPLRERAANFCFIGIMVVILQDTLFDMIDRQLGDMWRNAKAAQAGAHRAPQIVQPPIRQGDVG